MKTSYYQNPRLIAAQKAGAVAYALAHPRGSVCVGN